MSELLPTKLTPVARTVLGHGASLLQILGDSAVLPGQLWISVRESHPAMSYVDFTDALTMLFAVGLIDESDGVIVGGSSASQA